MNVEGLSSRVIWAGYLAMVLGNFMAILDIQIVASSLREIQAGVSASSDEIAWVQTSYLIAEVIAIPLSGLLGRAISMRRLFTIASLGFTVASVLCAMAWNIQSLIFFRALQGFLGGGMIPTTMAATFLLFPPDKRGPAVVIVGMVSTLAPSIGPTVGGYISDNMSWHWLFLLNLFPGLLCAAMVWLFSPLREYDLSLLKRIDVAGLIGMATFLGSLEFVLEEGPGEGWLQSSEIVEMSLVMLLGGVLFFWRAFTAKTPIVDLRVYSDRNFVIASLVSLIVGVGLYGSVYLIPLFLAGVRGYSAMQIGEVMMVTGIAMFLTAPIAGRLQAKFDLRLLLVFGIVLATTGLWLNSRLTADSSFDQLVLPQALRGAGLMICMIIKTGIALGTLPPDRVQNGSALFNLTRNLGGAIGLAVINSLIDHNLAFHRTELATAVSSGHADTMSWLDQLAASFADAGVADAAGAALAQLANIVEREALVMTFNNVFFILAITFALLIPLMLLTRPGKIGDGPGH